MIPRAWHPLVSSLGCHPKHRAGPAPLLEDDLPHMTYQVVPNDLHSLEKIMDLEFTTC